MPIHSTSRAGLKALATAAIGALGCMLSVNVSAETYIGPPSSYWMNTANWTPNTIPNSPGATAIFKAIAGVSNGVSLSGDATVGTLRIENAVAGGFGFQLGTLAMNGGAGPTLIFVESHNFTTEFFNNGLLRFDTDTEVQTVNAAATFRVDTAISGPGRLTKTGPGTATLSGANTYSGGTTVSAGAVVLSDAGTLGSTAAALKIDGGTLDLGGTSQTQNGGFTLQSGSLVNGTLSSTTGFTTQSGNVSAVLAGTGPLRQTGPGTTVLTGDNTASGGTTISGGTLQLGDGGTTGSVTGNVANNGTLLVNRTNATTLTGSVTGNGMVSLVTGRVTDRLTIANDYLGPSTLNLEVELGNSASPADVVTVQGSVSAASPITVNVTNVGGLGAETTAGNGILLIQVNGNAPANAFVLAGPGYVEAGGFKYRLVQVGKNWYLQTPRAATGVTAVPTLGQYGLVLLSALLVLFLRASTVPAPWRRRG